MKMFDIFLIILIIEIKTNIIIPFKFKEYPINQNETEENNFYKNFLFNIFFARIEIGTPSQMIEAQISGQNFGIQLKEGICFSSQYYNKKYSYSLKERAHCQNTNIYSYYKEISVNETISFKTDESQLKVKNFSLLYFKEFSEKEKLLIKTYGRKIELYEDLYDLFNSKNTSLEINKDGKACLLIGMKLSSSYSCLPNSNFVSILNDKNIIKDSNWAIKFNNNENSKEYDGEFIIGTLPHEYSLKEYQKDQLYLSNVLNYKYFQDWELQFKSIYFFKEEPDQKDLIKFIDINNNENIINVDKNINIEFNIDIKIILGSNNYYNYINQYFFKKNKDKCDSHIYDQKYKIIICDQNLNINNFPSLYFYNHIYNYTFEMNYSNLFLDKNNKKYFLIAFDESKPDTWTFGTLFLKKYFFVFNTNEKTIGFYNKEIIGNKNWIKLIVNIIYCLLIIIAGLGGFFFGKKIYYRVRNKRINELNDGFIYRSSDENKIALELASKNIKI